ncbi:MAG: periplasmic chaperone for outer membrane proteins Skp [Candidatus Electronema aureum]|uniref:Periplasmic chaperone for outer membrane proteins Skp n=1 Tax=Candidatus Electronema aureum TaxID=2005002 RepID=A0A521G0M4_9BACT|nr:MAG: periplasmic chaperone for outer membrane proteins Skp [Candidatus Electronema aureum]
MNRTAALLAALFFFVTASVSAAEVKIAVLNIQDVLTKSSAGMAAKSKIEQRMKELKASFESDKQQLTAFQDEMKKKASAWSDDKKQEQLLEFQKKTRDFEFKRDDARKELKNLEDKNLAPIMKELEGIVRSVAAAKGYSVVLPNTAVLYFDNSVDITGEVLNSLNAKLK